LLSPALKTLIVILVLCVCRPVAADPPAVTPDEVTGLLESMHPDYARYIGHVRYGATRLRPASLYAGLVRRGGRNPADPDDGPVSGRGVRNDLIIYADTFEPWRTHGWRMLVTDHEYFHALHLAHGAKAPVVGFGQGRADSDYYEALAWEYTLRRASEGIYGELAPKERAEAARRYRDHYEGFHRYVMERQPSAWAHYGRFLRDPAMFVRTASSAPTEAPAPAAGPGTR